MKRLRSGPSAAARRTLSGDGAGIVQGVIITPPLDVRAKNEGYNVMYRLIDLNIPFIYSSLHTSHKMLRERPEIVQRMVAAFAEIIYFVEKNPDKAKAAVSKAMRTTDAEAYQSATTPTPGDPRPHDGVPGNGG
jgi:ABC-type nitrate/sulfonate/bicarbonate transport system substrate-binding protein